MDGTSTNPSWKQRIKNITQQKHFKKIIIGSLILLTIVAILAYWIYTLYYVSTDDSYVNANVVQISSQVSGQVAQLNVQNNQAVKKDDVLLVLDQKPFIDEVNTAKAQLAIDQAKLEDQKLTQARIKTLFAAGNVSAQDNDNATANLNSAVASVQLSQARLDEAQLNLQYATLSAPVSGWVSNVTVRIGDVITKGQPLFALISDEEFWVDANFKEKDLEHIKIGQPAEITVDMYPGHIFKGVVESISGASGAAFSLLPPQNATGNWVKVTQRVPVRVRVINTDPNYPLRVGTSANVTISIGTQNISTKNGSSNP